MLDVEGERVVLKIKRIIFYKKLKNFLRDIYLVYLEEIFFCVIGVGFCNEREDLIKGDGGNKVLCGNLKCINRI